MRNRGELAEGWYDPATLQRAQQSEPVPADNARTNMRTQMPRSPIKSTNISPRATRKEVRDEESESDDSVGPALPGQDAHARRSRKGPSIPNFQDLEYKRGIASILSLQIHATDSQPRNGSRRRIGSKRRNPPRAQT